MGDKDAIGTEKEVDSALVAIHAKVNGVKSSLSAFVGKMEHEQLSWPSVLDSFSAFSGQSSNLMKQLCSDKIPPLHTRVLLPLQVCSDRDFDLERQTEGRIPMMHHDVVPNYLRTKLSLDLEAKQRDVLEEAKKRGPALKQDIKKFNEMLSECLERVNELKSELKDEMDEQRARTESIHATTAETKKLVAAYLNGTGLSQLSTRKPQQLASGGRPGGSSSSAGVRLQAMGRRDARSEQRQMAAAPYTTASPHKR